MYAIVTLDTANHLNNLITVCEAEADTIIFVQTEEAIRKEWFNKARNVFETHNVKGFLSVVLLGDGISDILGNVDQICDILLGELASDSSSYFNISVSGGHRLHAIMMWQVYLNCSAKYPDNFEVTHTEMQSKSIITWDMNQNIIKKTIKPLQLHFSLSDIVGLYGLIIGNIKSSLVYDSKLNKYNLNLLNDIKSQIDTRPLKEVEKFGLRFEFKFGEKIIDILFKTQFKNIKEIYIGVIIEKDGRYVAEYDVLIIDNLNKIYIVECKTNNAYSLKEVKAQKDLSKEWGGLFANFVVATNSNTLESNLVGVTTKIQNLLEVGINTYFEKTVIKDGITYKGPEQLLKDWRLI